jgi:Tfp pilus assembly pilus retraction ATPase PilT
MEDELDFSFSIANLSRFRGNVFKQRGCVTMVIRRVPLQIKTFAELQLPAVIATFAERARGLVLVTGPTGSGKSTTLAAMIDKSQQILAGIRAKVEHPFRVIKRQFGFTKVRYRGLKKNAAQVQTLFALSNLWMVRRKLMASAA